MEVQGPSRCVRSCTEGHREQRHGRCGRPRLGPARGRVGRGATHARLPGVELRPPVVEGLSRRQEGPRDPHRLDLQTLGSQPESSDRRVVRPDRTRVVAKRIEPGIARPVGAHTELVEQLWSDQVGGNGRDLVGVERTGPKDVSHVGPDAVDETSCPVHGETEVGGGAVTHPVAPADPLGQRGPSIAQLARAVPAEGVQQAGRALERLHGIRLRLDEGDGGDGDAAVAEADGVPRVLPSLVGQPGARLVEIFQQAVLVGHGIGHQPVHRRVERVQQPGHVLLGQAPLPRVMQEQDPQGGGVHRAVVDGGQRQAGLRVEVGDAPDLVRDLAGGLGRRVVVTDPLTTCQRPEGAARELGADGEGHPCRPDRVAAEQREIPGGSSSREHVLRRHRVGEQERSQVLDGAAHRGAEPRVGATHAHVVPRDEVAPRIGIQLRREPPVGDEVQAHRVLLLRLQAHGEGGDDAALVDLDRAGDGFEPRHVVVPLRGEACARRIDGGLERQEVDATRLDGTDGRSVHGIPDGHDGLDGLDRARGDDHRLDHAARHESPAAADLDDRVGCQRAQVAGRRQELRGPAECPVRHPTRRLSPDREAELAQGPTVIDIEPGRAVGPHVAPDVRHGRDVAEDAHRHLVEPGLAGCGWGHQGSTALRLGAACSVVRWQRVGHPAPAPKGVTSAVADGLLTPDAVLGKHPTHHMNVQIAVKYRSI